MKRILITGANGFVGRHLINSLTKDKNIFVLGLDKEKGCIMSPDIQKTIICDIEDKVKLKEVFKENNIDVVIHLAAVIRCEDRKEYEKTNIQGTESLIELSEYFMVKRFIFLSTDFVLYNTTDDYGISKKACECIIKSSKLNFTIFRPTPILGQGDTKNFTNLISVIKKYPVLPSIKCYMEPVYVGDIAKAIAASLENNCPPCRIYNLPGGSVHEFSEILSITAKLLGLKRVIVPIPKKIFLFALKSYEKFGANPLLTNHQVQKWLKTVHLDYSSAQKDLNYNPISFEEGMRLTIKEL